MRDLRKIEKLQYKALAPERPGTERAVEKKISCEI